MKCPNIHSPEWKELVDKVGKVEAISLYIKNDREIPTVNQIESLREQLLSEPIPRQALKEIEVLTDLRETAVSNLTNIYKVYDKIPKSKQNEGVNALLNDIKVALKAFEDASIKESLTILLNNIDNSVNILNKKLTSDLSLEGLKKAKDMVNSFSILIQVKDFILESSSIDIRLKNIALNRINSLLNKIDVLNSTYNKNIKNLVAQKLSEKSTLIYSKRKEELRIEFMDNNPKSSSTLTTDQYNDKLNEYVNSRLALEARRIQVQEADYIYDLLHTAPGDITAFISNIVDPKNVTQDHIIQLTAKLLENSSTNIRLDFLREKTALVQKYEKFIASRGSSILPTDQLALYDKMLEKDENGVLTQEYVKPYSVEFYNAKAELLQKLSELEEGSVEWKDIFIEFFNTYSTIKISNKAPVNVLFANLHKGLDNLFKVKPEYYNKAYLELQQDTELFDFYNTLIDINKRADSLVTGSGKKLGYRLPGISATTDEMIKQKGLKAAANNYFSDTIKTKSDDYFYGDEESIKILPTIGGKVYRTINVPFRKKLDLSEQSFDLAGMALTNMFFSLNYSHKQSIAPLLELTLDLVAERDVIKTSNSGLVKHISSIKKIFNVTKEEEIALETEFKTKGINSNSYKLLNSIIEDRLYGIASIPANIAGIDLNKVTSKLLKLSSNNMLILNLPAGIANFLQGKLTTFLEGVAGHNMTLADIKKGEQKYMKSIPSIVAEIGAIQPTNKTDLLMYILLGDAVDSEGAVKNLTADSKFKRVVNSNKLHFINNSVEHNIQGVLTYSYLNTLKAVNKAGKYVNAEGNVVTDIKDAATLDDIIEFNNGVPSLPNNIFIKGYELKNINTILADISNKLREIVKDSQGNYSTENKSQIQREWYGKLLFFMRKYIVPLAQSRYKGIQYANKSKQDLPLHLKGYSEALGTFKEGSYTTLTRFLLELKKSNDKLSIDLLSTNWNRLTDYEKGNVKKAVTEIAIMVACLLANTILSKLAEDDDDDDAIWALIYYNKRLWTDLMFFTPFSVVSGETTRLMESPTVALNTTKRIGSVISSLLEDATSLELRTYKSGINRGQSKSLVQINNLLNPFYKNFVNVNYKQKGKFY